MEEMDGVETSGRTIDEAIDRALNLLGLDRSQVEVEVLSEGRGGILGIGGGQARVFVRPLVPLDDEEEEELEEDELDEDELEEDELDEGEDEEEYEDEEEFDEEEDEGPPRRPGMVRSAAVNEAVDTLQNLLDLMGLDTEVDARPPQTLGDGAGLVEAVLDVTGEDLGLLIGRRGETLASLQYILNLIVRRRTRSHLTFGIDVEGYRRRREAMLNGLAHRMADRVRATGQSLTLEPMPPAERRIVHLALADDPDVLTVSIGEGDARKVAITPRH
jgi:spoIIIJ-associated protein